MKYFPRLIGSELYLSPMSLDDANVYTKWMNDLAITDRLGTSSLTTSLTSEEQWIRDNQGEYQFAIVRRQDDQLIGNCGLQELSQLHQTAEVGLFVGEEDERSKGYGAEVLRLLLDYSFGHLNLHSVMLKVFAFNERALRCYKKVGFREFGRRRACYYLGGQYHDQVLMDILREEWFSIHPPTQR